MKATRIGPVIPLTALVALAACPGEAPTGKRASAALEAKSSSTVTGTALFTERSSSQVDLTLNVAGATPGEHAAHIHLTGDCSADNAASAGGHWNPEPAMMHGLPTATPHHLGDLGNFTVSDNGTGKLTITGDWTIGTGDMTDVIGMAIIVHAMMDDGTTQTPVPGNAGARVACGVIK